MLVHLKTLLTNVEFELTTPKIKNYMLYLTEPARCPVGLLTLCTVIQKAFTEQDRMKLIILEPLEKKGS